MISPGQLIGAKYQLVREVGQGGMARVWEAEHTTLGSSVAVKFIVTGSRDAQRLTDRFLQEARAAAGIRHRNVVEILDFGRGEGLPFMVMEFLRGRSLADAIHSNSPPPVADLLRWVAEALSGLAAVHDQGLIHRDLKPANIFIASDADGEFAKIVDFGLSRTMGEVHPNQDSMFAGTPEYMSPEQARASTDLDKRTDLYSVGVILYQVLSGALPFADEELSSLLSSIQRAQPFSLRMSPGVGDSMIAVVDKAMARDRSQRFDSARSMREALLAATSSVRAVERTIVGGPILSRSSHAMTLDGTPDGTLDMPIATITPALTLDLPTPAPERVVTPEWDAPERVATPTPRWRIPVAAMLVALALGLGWFATSNSNRATSSVGETAELPRVDPPTRTDEIAMEQAALSEAALSEAALSEAELSEAELSGESEPVADPPVQDPTLIQEPSQMTRNRQNDPEPEPEFERDIGF